MDQSATLYQRGNRCCELAGASRPVYPALPRSPVNGQFRIDLHAHGGNVRRIRAFLLRKTMYADSNI